MRKAAWNHRLQKEKKKVVADDVINICFAFSKLREFKFDAEIKKTFFRFCVDNFREMLF